MGRKRRRRPMTVTSKSLIPTTGATSQLPPTAAKSTRDAGACTRWCVNAVVCVRGGVYAWCVCTVVCVYAVVCVYGGVRGGRVFTVVTL